MKKHYSCKLRAALPFTFHGVWQGSKFSSLPSPSPPTSPRTSPTRRIPSLGPKSTLFGVWGFLCISNSYTCRVWSLWCPVFIKLHPIARPVKVPANLPPPNPNHDPQPVETCRFLYYSDSYIIIGWTHMHGLSRYRESHEGLSKGLKHGDIVGVCDSVHNIEP